MTNETETTLTATQKKLGMKLYRLTGLHTEGPLAGQTTDVFKPGFAPIAVPMSGDGYVWIACEEVGQC